MDPQAILSTHLPPALGLTDNLLDTIAQAPNAEPFVGPDQAALIEMLATLPHPPPPDRVYRPAASAPSRVPP